MEKVVFTNGCFDLIHPGHVDLLVRARALGTKLVVGINSDRSVAAIKGAGRPFVAADERAAVLRGLQAVDEVVIFDEPTPERLIREISPDVLVKGGDWQEHEIIGADFVRSRGGQVVSLPLLQGYSTSAIAERISGGAPVVPPSDDRIAGSVREHLQVISALGDLNSDSIEDTAKVIVAALKSGRKLLVCGNGGSAADAQHLAAEIVGRFEAERRGYPAIALTTDTSALTAISNDYGYEHVFSRQVEALGGAGDVLVAVSTGGGSPNIIAAVMKARAAGMTTIALTGQNGRKLAGLCDHAILVPSTRTARIQEAHITVIHIWCEILDSESGE